jgi:hypothetical protein
MNAVFFKICGKCLRHGRNARIFECGEIIPSLLEMMPFDSIMSLQMLLVQTANSRMIEVSQTPQELEIPLVIAFTPLVGVGAGISIGGAG